MNVAERQISLDSHSFMRLLHHITSFAVSSSHAKTGFISHSPVVYQFLVHDIGKKDFTWSHKVLNTTLALTQ